MICKKTLLRSGAVFLMKERVGSDREKQTRRMQEAFYVSVLLLFRYIIDIKKLVMRFAMPFYIIKHLVSPVECSFKFIL